jgi:hypothetical protein
LQASRLHHENPRWIRAVRMQATVPTTKKRPLTLRYLLHAHKGSASAERAGKIAAGFAARKRFEVVKAQGKHQPYVIRRIE